MTTTAPAWPTFVSPTTRSPRRLALDAEWTKLRTLRSTWLAMMISVVTAVALAALASAGDVRDWDSMSAQEHQAFDATNTSLVGVLFTALVLGSLGVRAITSEYTTGMIRATASAIPRRGRILAAKVTVAATATFAVALVANVAGFAIGQTILRQEGIDVRLTDVRSLAAIGAGAVAVSAFAVIGVGLGTLVRRATLANILMAFVVIGGQIIGTALPTSSQKFLPFNALKATVSVHAADDLLSPLVALGLIVGYAVLAVTAAAIALHRRDV